jgi:hypothetical protein
MKPKLRKIKPMMRHTVDLFSIHPIVIQAR